MSPLLFIIVANSLLSRDAAIAYKRGDLADLTFADDTLLLAVFCKHLSEYLNAVAMAGARFGMELHSGKLQLLNVSNSNYISAPDGTTVKGTDQIGYLGTTIDQSGMVERSFP